MSRGVGIRHAIPWAAALAAIGCTGAVSEPGAAPADEATGATSSALVSAPRLWVANYGYTAGGWRTDRHPRTMADVNGDGKADVVGFGDAGVYVSLAKPNGDGFRPPKLYVANYGYVAGSWRVEQHPRVMADVNGDGKADVVGFGDAGVYVSLANGTGTSFGAPALWVANYGAVAGGWRVDQHPRMVTDVNGDHKADIVGFGNGGVYVSLSNGTNAFGAPTLVVNNFGYDQGWRVDQHPRTLADVDGDGAPDIVGFGNGGVYVSLQNTDVTSSTPAFSPPALWVANYGYAAGGWRVDQHPRFLADVNGDHRADVVGFGNGGVYVSTADDGKFNDPALWIAEYGYTAGTWRVDQHPRFVTDVNGDGAADIVGFGNAGVYISLSPGSSGAAFSPAVLWVKDFGVSQGWTVANDPRMLADVDGDGSADIVGFGDAGVYVSR